MYYLKNLKNLFISLGILTFAGSLIFFLWDILPIFWKIISFGVLLVCIFFVIKTFFSSALSFIFSYFSDFFTFLLALVITISIGFFGYQKLFNQIFSVEYWGKNIENLRQEQITLLSSVLAKKSPIQSITPIEVLKTFNPIPSPTSHFPETSLNSSSIFSESSISLSYTSDSSKNWKNPRVEGFEINTQKVSPKFVFLDSSDKQFVIPFQNINAQMVFPSEYSISNVVWTDSKDSIDQVQFVVQKNKIEAFVAVKITNKGELFNLLASKFINEKSNSENLFFITKRTEKTISYSSFFNGLLWEIEINIPFSIPPTDNDFYNILLPIVFEEKN